MYNKGYYNKFTVEELVVKIEECKECIAKYKREFGFSAEMIVELNECILDSIVEELVERGEY